MARKPKKRRKPLPKELAEPIYYGVGFVASMRDHDIRPQAAALERKVRAVFEYFDIEPSTPDAQLKSAVS
jgi:hypothetical protein